MKEKYDNYEKKLMSIINNCDNINIYVDKVNGKYEYRRIKNGDKKYQRAKKDRIWEYPAQARKYNNHWIVYCNMRRGRFCRYGGVRQKSSGISGVISSALCGSCF